MEPEQVQFAKNYVRSEAWLWKGIAHVLADRLADLTGDTVPAEIRRAREVVEAEERQAQS